MKKIIFYFLLLFGMCIGSSQVLCENCECEEVEENVEEVDTEFEFEIEGDLVLDEADVVGEEAGDVAIDAVADVAVDVSAEAIGTVIGEAVLSAIPFVGQVLQVLGAVAIAGYELYKLTKDTSANRRKHELAREAHLAQELEHNSWNPMFPSFSTHINDLESKKDRVSFMIRTAKFINEEDVADYLEEFNLICEAAYDESGFRRLINMNDEPLVAFTPCAFETWSHSYTAPANEENESGTYRDEFSWTLPEISLSVHNEQIKTNVKMYWATIFTKYPDNIHSFYHDTANTKRHLVNLSILKNNNILKLKLAKLGEDGNFEELADIPYTANDNEDGTINILVNDFSLSNYDADKYWVLAKVTTFETYGHIYEYLDSNGNPVGDLELSGNSVHNFKAYQVREKFIEKEEIGDYSQTIPNFNAGYGETRHPYIRQKKMSPSFLDGLIYYDPIYVFPQASKSETLFYAQLRDFQHYDEDSKTTNKDAAEINVIPSIKVVNPDFITELGEQLQVAKGNKNHFLIEINHLTDVKEIEYIELASLGLDKNIICELDIQDSGANDNLKLKAQYNTINERGREATIYSATPVIQDDDSIKFTLSKDTSQLVTEGNTASWILENTPFQAGESAYLIAHYKNGTLSKKLVAIPSLAVPFSRAFYTIRIPPTTPLNPSHNIETVHESESIYLSQADQDIDDESSLIAIDRTIAGDYPTSLWLIEHYGGSVYTFMNSKSKKILGIRDGVLGLHSWDPYDGNQYWHVDFLADDNVRLVNIGSESILSGDSNGIYHDFSAENGIRFDIDYVKDAEPILSDKPGWLINRKVSRYLDAINENEPVLADVSPFTNKSQLIRMHYQGSLHYTIQRVEDEKLLSDKSGSFEWSDNTTTPWQYVEVDENYFALSTKNYNWLGGYLNHPLIDASETENKLDKIYNSETPLEDESRHFSFTPQYPDYSECTSRGRSNNYEWINTFSIENDLGKYTNITGNTTQEGYGLYEFEEWELKLGEDYIFSITGDIELNDFYDEHYKVSLDIDRNGSFDPDEILWEGTSKFYKDQFTTVASSVTIPEGIPLGPIRIRVSFEYFNPTESNCDNFDYGEVEDYIVTLVGDVDYSECDKNLDVRSDFEWIESFSLGPYSNNSGNNGGYALFDETTWTFYQDEAYDLDYSISLDSDYYESVAIWIDYNKDGTFEDFEKIYSHGDNYTAPLETLTSSLIIPSNVNGVQLESGFTRMRIALKYYDEPRGCNEHFLWGELEDYKVLILPPDDSGGGNASRSAPTTETKKVKNFKKEEDVAAEDKDDFDFFTLHPNPTDSKVYVRYTLKDTESSRAKITIYNTIGNVVYESNAALTFTKGKNEVELDVGNLSSGAYIIHLLHNHSTKILTNRLLVE